MTTMTSGRPPRATATVEQVRAATLAMVKAKADAVARAEDELRAAVEQARSVGVPNGALGEVLGVSRQAVQQRFPRRATVTA